MPAKLVIYSKGKSEAAWGKILEARGLLDQAGVVFDSGFDVETGDYTWELDGSLRGAVIVTSHPDCDYEKGEA